MKRKKPIRQYDAVEPPINQIVDKLREQVRVLERTNMQFARDKARRTDQYKALLQVANLLLVVASDEIVRTDRDYAD